MTEPGDKTLADVIRRHGEAEALSYQLILSQTENDRTLARSHELIRDWLSVDPSVPRVIVDSETSRAYYLNDCGVMVHRPVLWANEVEMDHGQAESVVTTGDAS